MTRAEHLTWAKERAIAELEREGWETNAIASMMSDLQKHPGFARNALMICFACCPTGGTKEQLKTWIEGFQ